MGKRHLNIILMNEYNNLSVLPFYGNVSEQNARKWWVYGHIYPLFCGQALLPFQIQTDIPNQTLATNKYTIQLYNAHTDALVSTLTNMNYYMRTANVGGYVCLIYNGDYDMGQLNAEGQYYIKISVAVSPVRTYYSEVFTLVMDLSRYVKIEWWDVENFVMDAGTIVYDGTFKNRLYLQADIAKPEYLFEEENEDRDGYSFPIKQISEKKYKFNFLASEYLLDVMRFIRMADFVEITYNSRLFKPDTFLITPEWENEGDVAKVEAEFQTDTVAKKLGRGYIDTPVVYHSFNAQAYDDSFNK